MPIKVMHVVGSGITGGAENFVFTLAKHQVDQSNTIKPAILFRNGYGPFYDMAKKAGIETYACSTKIRFREIIQIIGYFRKFDVLHFHSLIPVFFLAAIFSFRKKLYYIHGARAMTKNPKEVFERFKHSGQLPNFRSVQRVLKRQWFKFFLRYFTISNHAPSDFYKQFYINKYKIPSDKIEVLPLGLDFERLRVTRGATEIKKEMGVPDGHFVVGTVSTFRKVKRLDRLINGFYLFHQKYGSINSCLIIVGDGDERTNLETLVAKYGIEKQVFFTGMQKNVADYLNIMDVFILPSESESFSLSCAEAMYFKKPVIVFRNSGGVEELVKKAGGFIVTDEKELCNLFFLVFEEREKTKLTGETLYSYVLKNLTIGEMNRKLIDIYNRLIL